MNVNELGQEIGFEVNDWNGCEAPDIQTIKGRFCILERLNPQDHGQDLYEAFATDKTEANWTYLSYGPFSNITDFLTWLKNVSAEKDPYFFAIIDPKSKQAIGLASLLRIDPNMGVVEVGHLHFSPLLQRTPLASEAMFLLMKYIFDDLGYRRYEWKCDSLNAPSKRAAQRLGFRFEGTFRQAMTYKGRNRDTNWYSILDTEWPYIKGAFEAWLSPDNFDDRGHQRHKLKAAL